MMKALFEKAPHCSVFDNNKLVVTHRAVKRGQEEHRFDRSCRSVHISLCMFGETSGNFTEDGHPERTYGWVENWDNSNQTVVFGHDVMSLPTWLNKNVVAIDTGCVFGGHLTALRWPDKQIVQIKAVSKYAHHKTII